MRLSTHVLDAALGQPAARIPVRLDRLDGGAWVAVASGVTGSDGRLARWQPRGAAGQVAAGEPAPDGLAPGLHRLTFETGGYFAGQGIDAFYPEVTVTFQIRDAGQHYHLPLLLSPYAYSTYRGS